MKAEVPVLLSGRVKDGLISPASSFGHLNMLGLDLLRVLNLEMNVADHTVSLRWR